jgi:exonuclease III
MNLRRGANSTIQEIMNAANETTPGLEGLEGTNIFCFQELSARKATNRNIEDAFSIATGTGWSVHSNHQNAEKKGGGAAIVTSPLIRCSERRRDLEPVASSSNQHLDIVVAGVGMTKNCDRGKQMLVASVYRSPGREKKNVHALCKWLKQMKQHADKQYAGLLICGDFNLHLQSVGNTQANCSKQMKNGCKMMESAMAESDLRLLNTFGTMTRFEDGKASSIIDLAITGGTGNARINFLSFKNSWRTLPAWHGSDHFPIIFDLLWPFATEAAQQPKTDHPRCRVCRGRGADHGKSLAKVQELLQNCGLAQSMLPKFQRMLREDEKQAFADAVTVTLQAHLAAPTAEARGFGAAAKNMPHAPWTLDVAAGMAHLANSLTLALDQVVAARTEQGTNNRGRRPKRRQRSGRSPAEPCSCPAPTTSSTNRGSGRPRFWTSQCATTKNKWNKALRIAKKAKMRHAGPIAMATLRLRARKCRTAHRSARAEAKREFWGIKEGKLDRFTTTKELHKLIDLLQGTWTDDDTGGDALAKAFERRGGVTMTAKNGIKITARGGGLDAANLLTQNFAQTTMRMTDDEALAITRTVVERRAKEQRPPLGFDLVDHVKQHLEETDAWLATREAEGGELAVILPNLAPPLPPADTVNQGRAFSIAEVTACKHKRKGKATWHDKVTTEMMDTAGALWDQCFTTMLNLILLTGEWPKWFKDARMRNLIKSTANSYTTEVDAKHTRPISILPAMAKRGDAVMYKRTEYLTESKNEGTAVGDKQFGFRPQRGCVDNLFSHVQDVKSNWRKGWFTVEVCRDGVKAYDKVDHASLLRKLSDRHGLKGPLLRMIAGFLRDRTAHTILGDHVGDTFELYYGVPQGACASPGLYIVDVDEQARLCDGTNTDLFGTPVGNARVAYYADDARIYVMLPGPDAEGVADWKAQCKTSLSHFQDLLDESTVLAAMSRQAFSADPKKLQSVAYIPETWTCRKEILDALPSLFVQDQEIQIDTEPIVALGLKLDAGLTFESHIMAKIGMAHQRLDVMERLNAEPWYTDAHTMVKRVYTPWVASLWEYASPCWGTACPRILKKIDAVERRALAICLNIPTSSCAARLSLLRETKCDSAQQRRLIAAAMQWHKVNSSHRDSQAGRMLSEWKESAPDWEAEVEEAKNLCAWIDQQTEKVLSGEGKPHGAIKAAERARPLITPLAFCAAAAETLQMTLEQVGALEPFGLESAEQRQCPFSSDPCGGYAMPLAFLPRTISTESFGEYDWEQLFPRGWENRGYEWPILGSASERSVPQKKMADAYALAMAICAKKQATKHESSVVCATDGACQTSFGSSVLAQSRIGIHNLWTRQGGGAGAAIAGAHGKVLAAFGTRHGHVNDSAADEMGGMHAVLMALVAAYMGKNFAAQIDPTGLSSEASQDLKWKTSNQQPPPCLKIEKGKTTIIITCDNQDVVRAARTESLKMMPHRGGTARAPGYAMHNEIVNAKRELTRAGASVQIVWVPGHTETCKLNIVADAHADKAAVSSGYTSLGRDAMSTTRPMLRNHLKRRAKQLLNNSWYHWYLEQQLSPWGPKRAIGHAYLDSCVLWHGNTVNWFDDEAVRHENAQWKPRWLAMPEKICFATNSFQAAKSVVRLRLNLATKNVADGRTVKLFKPKCPWCDQQEDSGRHRFECAHLQPQREALVGRLRAATSPRDDKDGPEPPAMGTRSEQEWSSPDHHDLGETTRVVVGVDTRSDQEVLLHNFTWDVLVKGDYAKGEFYNLERFTAPPKETRQALADIVHTFLKDTMFFSRVFGQQADCCDVVKQACKEKKQAEEAAATAQQAQDDAADVAAAEMVAQQAPNDAADDAAIDAAAQQAQDDAADVAAAAVIAHATSPRRRGR